MLLASLYVSNSYNKGRGIFTSAEIFSGAIIEVSPVIVMSKKERLLLDQTLLHDYIFEWGHKKNQCCVALGYVSIYNHSYEANCEYEMDFAKEQISIKTIRDIPKGSELFINYNGDWDNKKKLWFDVS